MPAHRTTPIREYSLDEMIGRLETYVSRMERRYECPSAKMATLVRDGRIHATAEVGRWLADYRVLVELKEYRVRGRAVG